MLLNLPIMAGLILLPELVILVLFGEVWLPAAPILAILAVGGILLPIHVVNIQLVLARADSATFMRNEIAKKSIGVACVLVGSLFGIVGLAWSQVVYSVLVNARPAGKILGYGPFRQLRDLRGMVLATLVMAVAVFLLKEALSTTPLLTLAICTITGAAVYAATGWFGGFKVFREASDILSREFAGRWLSRSGVS
jgi:teichuronic acid exporter